jgi:hypothetical protein
MPSRIPSGDGWVAPTEWARIAGRWGDPSSRLRALAGGLLGRPIEADPRLVWHGIFAIEYPVRRWAGRPYGMGADHWALISNKFMLNLSKADERISTTGYHGAKQVQPKTSDAYEN